MKKFFINIGYFCLINICLFMVHIWAFFGVAFNDTSIRYNTIIEALPVILIGISPLVIGSIILSIAFRKKKDFNVYIFWVLQLLVILYWLLFYINNYI